MSAVQETLKTLRLVHRSLLATSVGVLGLAASSSNAPDLRHALEEAVRIDSLPSLVASATSEAFYDRFMPYGPGLGYPHHLRDGIVCDTPCGLLDSINSLPGLSYETLFKGDWTFRLDRVVNGDPSLQEFNVRNDFRLRHLLGWDADSASVTPYWGTPAAMRRDFDYRNLPLSEVFTELQKKSRQKVLFPRLESWAAFGGALACLRDHAEAFQSRTPDIRQDYVDLVLPPACRITHFRSTLLTSEPGIEREWSSEDWETRHVTWLLAMRTADDKEYLGVNDGYYMVDYWFDGLWGYVTGALDTPMSGELVEPWRAISSQGRPRLALDGFLSDVEGLQLPEVIGWLEAGLQDSRRRLPLLEVEFSEELAVVLGPAALLAVILYLLAHLHHLEAITRDSDSAAEVRAFPLILTMGGILACTLRAVAVVLLPFAGSFAMILRFSSVPLAYRGIGVALVGLLLASSIFAFVLSGRLMKGFLAAP